MNEPEVEVVYRKHKDALYSFLLSLTRSEVETKDIFQAVFLKVARRPSLLGNRKDSRAYLLKMAHNLWIDQIRREIRRTEIYEELRPAIQFEESQDPDQQFFAEELGAALDKIPEEQRAVVHLKVWEEMTFQEIGEILRISSNTAASRYRYALDKLAGLIRHPSERL